MHDDAVKAALEEAVRQALSGLASDAAQSSHGRKRALALKTVAALKRRIETDPAFVAEISSTAKVLTTRVTAAPLTKPVSK